MPDCLVDFDCIPGTVSVFWYLSGSQEVLHELPENLLTRAPKPWVHSWTWAHLILLLSHTLTHASKTGPGPQQSFQEKQLVAQEKPAQEEDAEELRALPHPSPSLDGENRGIRTRDPVLLALAGPLVMEGLADAALEDGKCLKDFFIGPWYPSSIAHMNFTFYLLKGSYFMGAVRRNTN